jgi:hypothetical protein
VPPAAPAEVAGGPGDETEELDPPHEAATTHNTVVAIQRCKMAGTLKIRVT